MIEKLCSYGDVLAQIIATLDAKSVINIIQCNKYLYSYYCENQIYIKSLHLVLNYPENAIIKAFNSNDFDVLEYMFNTFSNKLNFLCTNISWVGDNNVRQIALNMSGGSQTYYSMSAFVADHEMETPIHIAVESFNMKALEILLSYPSIDLQKENRSELTSYTSTTNW
jgi:hypothetical protein